MESEWFLSKSENESEQSVLNHVGNSLWEFSSEIL